ncbi:MAG: hypothetical protein K8F60_16270 [Melioribacteraceae bacterium]|nr:hypothetical protein [Melioribacteraceae bacterium]
MTDLTMLSNHDVINLMYGKSKDDSFTISHEINVRNEKLRVTSMNYVGSDETISCLFKGNVNYQLGIAYKKENYFDFINKLEADFLSILPESEKADFKELTARLRTKRNK